MLIEPFFEFAFMCRALGSVMILAISAAPIGCYLGRVPILTQVTD